MPHMGGDKVANTPAIDKANAIITVRAPPKRVMSLADNGQGIAPELLPRIFDPFVTTRMGRGGTGLGLHIVHNLVFNTLGGSVSVKSQVGEGTEFQLELPLIAPAQAKPE